MEQVTRELAVAFGLGSIGAPVVGEGRAETLAGQQGLGAMESTAQYVRAARALAVVDVAHPELGIRAAMERAIDDIRGSGDVSAVLSRIDALLVTAKPYLPA